MPFIQTLGPEADARLAEIYAEWEQKRGFMPNNLKALTLKPDLLLKFTDFSNAITFGGSSLGRRREEFISFFVSNLLHCKY